MPDRRLTRVVTVLSLMIGGLPSAAFAGAFDPNPASALNPYGGDARSQSLAAGVALRVPLDGDFRRSFKETRFSLSLDMRSTGGAAFAPYGTVIDSRPLLNLSVGLKGYDSLALNGVRFTEMQALYADGEDGGDGVNWWWIAGGVIAAGFAVGLIAVAKTDCFAFCEDDELKFGGQ